MYRHPKTALVKPLIFYHYSQPIARTQIWIPYQQLLNVDRYEQHIHATDFSPSRADSSCVIQLSAEQGRPSFCQQNLVNHNTSTWGQHIKFMFKLTSAGSIINMTKLSTGYHVILRTCKKISWHSKYYSFLYHEFVNFRYFLYTRFKLILCIPNCYTKILWSNL